MRTMVIIDDEPGIRDLLRELLEENGDRVISLGHPAQLDLLEGQEPDLFFVDLMLPSMTGMDLAREVRQGPYGRTPMVAMSASRMQLLFAARSGLFQDLLVKPFDLYEVVDLVDRYTGARLKHNL